jgi:hypothetical protein
MKHIDNFIIEKLKLNPDSKITDTPKKEGWGENLKMKWLKEHFHLTHKQGQGEGDFVTYKFGSNDKGSRLSIEHGLIGEYNNSLIWVFQDPNCIEPITSHNTIFCIGTSLKRYKLHPGSITVKAIYSCDDKILKFQKWYDGVKFIVCEDWESMVHQIDKDW